jgi:hypothetical protein
MVEVVVATAPPLSPKKCTKTCLFSRTCDPKKKKKTKNGAMIRKGGYGGRNLVEVMAKVWAWAHTHIMGTHCMGGILMYALKELRWPRKLFHKHGCNVLG